MGRVFIITLLLLISVTLLSQDSTNAISFKPKMELLFSKNHFGGGIIPYIGDKTNINRTSGIFALSSSVLFEYEIYVEYLKNFDINNSLSIGISERTVKHGYSFFASNSNFDPATQNSNGFYTKWIMGIKTYALPIMYEYRKFLNVNKYIGFDFGFTIRYSSETNTSLMLSDFFENKRVIYTELIDGRAFWHNYNTALVFCSVLKNHNIFKIGFRLNLAIPSFYAGKYEITLPDQEKPLGSYNVKGTYVGIDCSYLLTRTRKKIN